MSSPEPRGEPNAAQEPVPGEGDGVHQEQPIRERFTGGRLTSPGVKARPGLSRSERVGWWVALAALVVGVAALLGARDEVWFALRFGDSAEREGAAVRLGDDPEGVETLLILSRDADAEVRRAAVVSLARQLPASAPALDGLIRATEDSAVAVRRAAVRALGSAAPSAKAAEALRRILGGPDPALHASAAEALAPFGEAAAEAVPSLIAMSLSHQRKAGSTGDSAGATLDTLRASALTGLVAATRHVSPDVRRDALRRLGELAVEDPAAREALSSTVRSPFADVRAAATVATARREGVTPDVLTELTLLAEKPETRGTAVTGLREAARTGLAQGLNEAQAAIVVPRLLTLGGEDDVDRRAAITLLHAIGPPAVGPLIEAVRRAVEPERERALMALARLGPARWASNDNGESLALLEAEMLADRTPERVAAALVARGAEGIPALVKAVRQGKRPVRLAAIDALPRLSASEASVATLADTVRVGGLVGERALTALTGLGSPGLIRMAELLTDRDAGTRRRVAAALSQAPSEMPEAAIPAVTLAARHRDAAVRSAAVRLLLRLSGARPEVAEALERAARDRSPVVKRALREARGSIDPAPRPAVPQPVVAPPGAARK